MNEHEKYFFNVNGYLVVQKILSPELVAALKEAIEHNQYRVGRAVAVSKFSNAERRAQPRGHHGNSQLAATLVPAVSRSAFAPIGAALHV